MRFGCSRRPKLADQGARHDRDPTNLVKVGGQTSRNLEQAYGLYPTIRLGEEAITEHNLLAIATTHPREIQIHAFGKKE